MKYRPDQRGFTLIELTVVVCMIALLMATSVKYYQDIMADARKSGLQLLSSRFTSTIAMLHVKWITEQQPQSLWLDEETEIVMNSKGWPVGAKGRFIKKEAGACRQLWEGLFQNSGPIEKANTEENGGAQYRVERPEKGVCRYVMLVPDNGEYYFDYYSSSGKVKSSLN